MAIGVVFTCQELRRTKYGSQFKVAAQRAYRLQINSPRLLLRSQIKGISSDEWRSFLLSFRKLVAETELGNLFRTLNVLSNHGNRADQARIRQIKTELRAVEKSNAGVRVFVGSELRPIIPKAAYLAMINGVLFHNDPDYSKELEFYRESSLFANGVIFHYVVFTFLQAIRIEASIRARGYV
ncbi:hypothetical protein [Polaromonas sp. YR568]|uniref:hypothetical protein n=1 Tax=Polaromonas sp. YR568 TaxID=1855301 RepID=UPI0031381CF1